MSSLVTESTALQHDFQRDGFMIHRQSILGPEQLARAVHGMLEVRAGRYDTGRAPHKGTVFWKWEPGQDETRLCKIEQPQFANRALQETVASPELGRLVAEAVGAKEFVQVWWVQLLHKPGNAVGAGPQIGWHQDLAYWSGWEDDSEIFTAWLALADVGEDNGPMLFVPGSQRWGIRPGGDFDSQDQNANRSAMGLPDGETWRELPVCLPAGGFSLHHRLTIHGSRPNHGPRPRLSLAIHLRSERSRPKPGSWESEFLDDPAVCPVIWRRS